MRIDFTEYISIKFIPIFKDYHNLIYYTFEKPTYKAIHVI